MSMEKCRRKIVRIFKSKCRELEKIHKIKLRLITEVGFNGLLLHIRLIGEKGGSTYIFTVRYDVNFMNIDDAKIFATNFEEFLKYFVKRTRDSHEK
jgi:hypothetical protein